MSEYIVKYNGDILSTGYPAERLTGRYAIMELTDQQARDIVFLPEIEYLEPSQKLFPSINGSMDYAYAAKTGQIHLQQWKGSGVIIGVIDSGIDISHTEFIRADGKNAVLALWDLTLVGTPPSGFLKGHDFNSGDIAGGRCDSADAVGHGTAVAAIAAGNSGIAPEASIIAVKLGGAGSRTTDVLRGIQYIQDKARQFNMPCVINLSYGTNNGSHRGHSLFEAYIDEAADAWKTVIVSAAGNEGHSGHHFSGKLEKDFCLKVDFAVRSPQNEIYLTLWKNFADTVTYELVLPNGQRTGAVTLYDNQFHRIVGGLDISILYRAPNHYSSMQEVLFSVKGPPDRTTGLWSLLCCGESIVDGSFDIWLPTVEEVTEQTAFMLPDADMTLTLPATASKVMTVGGYRIETNTACAFSGRGSELCRTLAQLDLVAPAENVFTAKAGSGYDTFSGTSMASPLVAGAAAILMEWGIVQKNDPFLYGQKVKAFLCKNADRDVHLAYPNSVWGYGKLNLQAALKDLEHYRGR